MKKEREENMKERSRDYDARAARGVGGWALLLHLVCCGLPVLIFLLISAGLTVEMLWRAAPYLALVGLLVALFWLLYSTRRRCWSCSVCDRNAKGHTHSLKKTAP